MPTPDSKAAAQQQKARAGSPKSATPPPQAPDYENQQPSRQVSDDDHDESHLVRGYD